MRVTKTESERSERQEPRRLVQTCRDAKEKLKCPKIVGWEVGRRDHAKNKAPDQPRSRAAENRERATRRRTACDQSLP